VPISSASVRVGVALTLTLAVCVLAGAAPAGPDAAGNRFFEAVRRHDYGQAYGLLSEGVRRDLPYPVFAQRSRDITWFQVLELQAIERGRHLARYRVRGRVKMVHHGDLFNAVYAGTVSLSLDDGAWRIRQVELRPVEQKRLGKAPPAYQI